jgi:hypothetical protein
LRDRSRGYPRRTLRPGREDMKVETVATSRGDRRARDHGPRSRRARQETLARDVA